MVATLVVGEHPIVFEVLIVTQLVLWPLEVVE